jgi:hypothetical protein
LPATRVLFNCAYSQEGYYLVNLIGTHFFSYGMIAGIDPDQGSAVIIINLDLGEIRDAVLAFCKNTMTAGAVEFIKNLALVSFLDKQYPVFFGDMVRDIIACFLLCAALLEQGYAEYGKGYGINKFHSY